MFVDLLCTWLAIVLNICMKCHENISNGIRVMKWTQMSKVLTDGGRMDGHKISEGIT